MEGSKNSSSLARARQLFSSEGDKLNVGIETDSETASKTSWQQVGGVWQKSVARVRPRSNSLFLSCPNSPVEGRRRSSSNIERKVTRAPSPLVFNRQSSDSSSGSSSSSASRKSSLTDQGPPSISLDSNLPTIPSTPVVEDAPGTAGLPQFTLTPADTLHERRRGSLISISSETSEQEMKLFLASDYSRRRASAPFVDPVQTKTLPLVKMPTPPSPKEHHALLPKKAGLDFVANYPGQGIPRCDLEGIQKAIQFDLAAVSIRPFSKLATNLKLAGCRSKDLEYKLKSGGWGPHCALLPIEQKYCKKIGADSEKIAELQRYADDHRDEAVQLKLTEDRLTELATTCFDETDQQVLENLVREENGNVRFTARPKDHPVGGEYEYQFKGVRNKDGDYEILVEEDGEFVPFEVIELIPDYDLGFIFFHNLTVNLAQEDKSRWEGGDIGINSLTRLLQEKAEKRRGSFSGVVESLERPPVLGEVTTKEKGYLDKLNRAVGRSSDNPMFHHGPDNRSPVTQLEDNWPLTVILSRPVGVLTENYYIINNVEELTAFVQELKDNNYHAPISDRWGKVTKVKSKHFTQYQRHIEAKNKGLN